MGYDTLDEAIEIHNDVPQGLSSAIFTDDVREAELFLSPRRQRLRHRQRQHRHQRRRNRRRLRRRKSKPAAAASPAPTAWKAYMRRATNTINYSQRTAAGAGNQVRR